MRARTPFSRRVGTPRSLRSRALPGLLLAVAWIAALGLRAPAAGAVPRDPPPPIALEADELDRLARRRIVVRPEIDGGSDRGAGGATGVIDLAAPPSAALDAILDVGARVGEITGLEAVEVYASEPTAMGIRPADARANANLHDHGARASSARQVARSGFEAIEPGERRATRRCGRASAMGTRPADARANANLHDQGARASSARQVARSYTDSGRAVPRWLARWIASESLSQQLEGIRARAERR